MKDKKVIMPQIYTDFNKKLYCTLGVSNPIKMNDYIEHEGKKISFNTAIHAIFQCINVFYTQDINPYICMWFDEYRGNYYHLERINNKKLILYKALYDDGDKGIYATEENKFFDEMEEYNQKQTY